VCSSDLSLNCSRFEIIAMIKAKIGRIEKIVKKLRLAA
jgi:hypothetical protein